jgi:hypothetical protein
MPFWSIADSSFRDGRLPAPDGDSHTAFMPSDQPLCASLLRKIEEQIERTEHLAAMAPNDRLDWKPPAITAWTLGALLGHLLDCMAGMCAALAAANPAHLAHFAELRSLPVNHPCSPPEAIERIALYCTRIHEGFALLRDPDLARSIPTIFVPEGETLLTLLLGNLEHLINHKHQLFVYLQQMGLAVNSSDLYRFRGGE